MLFRSGLVPEKELAEKAGVKVSPVTGGAVVDEGMMTSVEGIFECGNVLHVHDLVDFVSKESEDAGASAVRYIQQGIMPDGKVSIVGEDGVRYVVPQYLSKSARLDKLQLKMRVSNVFKNKRLVAEIDGEEVLSKKKQIVTPGEMESIVLTGEQIKRIQKGERLTLRLKD